MFNLFFCTRSSKLLPQVRNSCVTQDDRDAAGFWDASLAEKERIYGAAAVKRLIDQGLQNTSVTVVLIGAETSTRKWVLYEIEESVNRGNGLLGVHINRIPNLQRQTDYHGLNPFDQITVQSNGRGPYRLSQFVQTYDWTLQDGYTNLGNWIEMAARKAGR